MKVEQVVSILESLASGVDPATGEELPRELFQSTDVVRALFSAANLLRNGTRAAPAAAGARWTGEEDAQLCREYDQGMAIADIARQHGRTPGSITSRLVKLGRIDASAVRPRERGMRMAS